MNKKKDFPSIKHALLSEIAKEFDKFIGWVNDILKQLTI